MLQYLDETPHQEQELNDSFVKPESNFESDFSDLDDSCSDVSPAFDFLFCQIKHRIRSLSFFFMYFRDGKVWKTTLIIFFKLYDVV